MFWLLGCSRIHRLGIRMSKKVIIFGTGILGKTAYKYFEKRYNIACFLDNDVKKWNQLLFGKPIMNPEILKEEKDVMVVVPGGIHKEEMCEQVYSYGIKEVILLNFEEKIYTPYIQKDEEEGENEFVIQFKGGLGNQLFQYAFMRYLIIKEKKKCSIDLSYYIYPHVMKYMLQDVFKKVTVKRCNPYIREKYLSDEELCYCEGYDVGSAFECFMAADIKKVGYGYLTGYYQSASFPEAIKDTLKRELLFPEVDDAGMKKYLELLKEKNTVSIHIRRGDYLSETNNAIYGNICNEEYYLRAMEYILQSVENPIFVLFSDDIEWVKKNCSIKNAIYIESKEFQNYSDWYDMYLMSMCRHNVIANSTFSWWGAWLNDYEEKIVIAPKKWFNQKTLLDICPTDWIRL